MTNTLAFGKPGSGKTHLLCANCHELARQGRNVSLWLKTYTVKTAFDTLL